MFGKGYSCWGEKGGKIECEDQVKRELDATNERYELQSTYLIL